MYDFLFCQRNIKKNHKNLINFFARNFSWVSILFFYFGIFLLSFPLFNCLSFQNIYTMCIFLFILFCFIFDFLLGVYHFYIHFWVIFLGFAVIFSSFYYGLKSWTWFSFSFPNYERTTHSLANSIKSCFFLRFFRFFSQFYLSF